MRATSLEMVYQLAKEDERIFFIGSDLGSGTLDHFKTEMPDRFFMEGISEANLIGVAAGLALEGKIVYFNTIATFIARRAFEQVAIDLCLHNVPVRLIANGGGLVYAPLGPTHLAIEDLSTLRALPNLTIIAVADADEMRRMMPQTVDYPGPIYIRLAKGHEKIVSRPELPFEIGKALVMQTGQAVLLVTTGVGLHITLEAAQQLQAQGITPSILHMHTLKPLDETTLLAHMAAAQVIITVEENTVIGGLGGAVAEVLAEANFSTPKRFKRIGIPDVFPDQYGSQNSLMSHYGITAQAITETALKLLKQ